MTVSDPVAESYHPNLTLAATEQGILAGKLRGAHIDLGKRQGATVQLPVSDAATHRKQRFFCGFQPGPPEI
jgi:hypothetical protein